LGIDLNEDVLGNYPFKCWHRAFTYTADGALAYQ
jgi:hypothetical protein